MSVKKRKIAFVIGKLSSGGAERVISTLANCLIDRYDIVIIPFVENKPFYPLHDDVKIIPCKSHIKTPKNIFGSLKLNFDLIRKTSQILRKEKVDIAIGFITSANIITVVASKICGIPSIISERNNPMIENVPKFWVLLRNFFYPKADYVVLQTQGIKSFFQKKLNESKTIILPNPIAQELSDKRNDQDKKEKIVLSVGRLDINKCHDQIIKAFHKINKKDWKLMIVGEGDYEPHLKKLISDLDLVDSVSLVPATKNISDHYNAAEIFAFASRTEGFPNALLEAMHFGLPCISTDCPFGPADLIENQKNGYLVPVDDLENFKERLELLMNDDLLRKTIGKSAKNSTEKFKTEKVVEKWGNLVEQALKKSSNKTRNSFNKPLTN